MADDNAVASASGSSIQSEEARFVTLDKAASRKRYEQQRNATRLSLMGEYGRWRNLKNELLVKSGNELASILLDHYISHEHRRFRYYASKQILFIPNIKKLKTCFVVK